jgi:hypothetical protein
VSGRRCEIDAKKPRHTGYFKPAAVYLGVKIPIRRQRSWAENEQDSSCATRITKGIQVPHRLPWNLVLLLAPATLTGCSANNSTDPPPLTAEQLDDSIALCRRHLIAVQQPEGNFQYETHLETGASRDGDQQVRQAATLWAIGLMHLHAPGQDTREALFKGIGFFRDNERSIDDGRYFVYPDSNSGHTGMVALVTLAKIEFLRAEPQAEEADRLREEIAGHVKFLLSLRTDEGRFQGFYRRKNGEGYKDPSPYYDGETLLALTKAANYLDHDELQPVILQAAEAMWNAYFVEPGKTNDQKTRGQFYQWGSMAFLEIYESGWEGSLVYADRALEMAEWRLDRLKSSGSPPRFNNATAYEGLCPAWKLAGELGNPEMQDKIGRQIDRGLRDLLTFQVGGPNPNKYLQEHSPADEIAIGGCLSAAEEPWLRIDFTQHQVHSIIMTRRFMFAKE